MVWLRNIGGRLKSAYRYSIGLASNTFPLPKAKDLTKLTPFAQAILDAGANHPDATFAALCDPDVMPADHTGGQGDVHIFLTPAYALLNSIGIVGITPLDL